jgi:D-hexose-6-phosphate mutarotase
MAAGDWCKFVCVEPVGDWPGGRTLEPGASDEFAAAIQSNMGI